MDTSGRTVRTKYGDRCTFRGWFQWYCPDCGARIEKEMDE